MYIISIKYFTFILFILVIISCKKTNVGSISVFGIDPPKEGPGVTVKIDGKGFGNDTAHTAVYFNGVKANIVSITDSEMLVTIPAGAQSGTVTIKANGLIYQSSMEYQVLTGTWTKKANFPGAGRYYAAAFTVNGKGYVVSGSSKIDTFYNWYNDMYEYDPTTDSWTKKASLPAASRDLAIAMGIGGKGYLIGGMTIESYSSPLQILNDVWQYDPLSDSWTQMGNFPGVARNYCTGFAIGNKGYYGLGYIAPGQLAKDWWAYDPGKDQWTRKADFPHTEMNAYGLSTGGNGFLMLTDPPYVNWYSYDTALDQWSNKKNLPELIYPAGASFSINDKAYIIIGSPGNSWEYDPSGDNWTQKTSQPVKRQGGVSFTIGNKGYAGIGGTFESNFTITTTDWWEFQP